MHSLKKSSIIIHQEFNQNKLGCALAAVFPETVKEVHASF